MDDALGISSWLSVVVNLMSPPALIRIPEADLIQWGRMAIVLVSAGVVGLAAGKALRTSPTIGAAIGALMGLAAAHQASDRAVVGALLVYAMGSRVIDGLACGAAARGGLRRLQGRFFPSAILPLGVEHLWTVAAATLGSITIAKAAASSSHLRSTAFMAGAAALCASGMLLEPMTSEAYRMSLRFVFPVFFLLGFLGASKTGH